MTIQVFATWMGRVSKGVLAGALLLVLGVDAKPMAAQSAPSWTENNAYQAYTGYYDYFAYGPNTSSYNDPTGNGTTYTIFAAYQTPPSKSWNTFWYEAEEIELAEDAYYWAANNNGDTQKYVDQINALSQGFIDLMNPPSNFGGDIPENGGDPYNWHGTGYASDNYSPGPEGGDWFNDDLMWAAIAFARAYQITGTQGWLTAAEEQVNYVWTDAKAETNAAGTEVGLLQSFCNANNGKDGNCQSGDTSWAPNLDSEVNFTFVIAADLLANNTSGSTSTMYQNERNAVYAWAMDNLYTTTSSYATTCATNSGVTCAEIYDSNNTASWSGGSFNGENSYWAGFSTSNISTSEYTMNYGNAIQAAIRMGDTTTAQYIANYLMYGLTTAAHTYAGTYSYDGNSYNILPNYWTPPTYSEGGNFDASNGIALRGVAYGLTRNDLNSTTLAWAQANLQAAWNNRNSSNVIWTDWTPGHKTNPSSSYYTGTYTYNSWDCTGAVAGMLTVPAP